MFHGRILPLAAGAFVLWSVPGCGKRSQDVEDGAAEPRLPAVTVRELDLPRGGEGPVLFEEAPSERTGLAVAPMTGAERARYEDGILTVGGMAVGDIDGDGREDVFVVNGPGANQLFRQTEGLRFEDISVRAGIAGGDAWGTGVALADLDGDRDNDLLVCNHDSPNQCFLNDGKGVFREAAAEMGLNAGAASLMAALADYDGDGDLDVFLLSNRYCREGGMPEEPTYISGGRTVIKRQYARWYHVRASTRGGAGSGDVFPVGQRDFLFRNRGDGTFEDVSGRVGDLCAQAHKGVAAAWVDVDDDGDLDVYVVNEGEDGVQLYRNEEGVRFRLATRAMLPYTPWFGRGVAVGDVNGDLAIDLLSLSHGGGGTDLKGLAWLADRTKPRPVARSVLWQNTGYDRFQEVAVPYGFVTQAAAWAPLLGDYDQDGWMDAMISTEEGLHAWKGGARAGNEGGVTFEEVGRTWGLPRAGAVRGLVQGDLDADGDLDVLARTADGRLRLFENTAMGGDRLLVELVARKSPTTPIGARIEVKTSEQRFMRTFAPGTGLQAWHGTRIPVALGVGAENIRVMIRWPSGVLQELSGVAPNSHIIAVEPEGAPVEPVRRLQPLFAPSEVVAALVHRESGAGDFLAEEAMLGPGMACADLNADGLDDVYLGGAAGHSGQLFIRKSKNFREPVVEPFLDDRASEDLGAVFADFDTDGHVDLFVVSGGVEARPGAASYRDRLYLGNGRGGFMKAQGAVPDLRDSGGAVSAADFDRDGDLDVFVGGRCVPGRPEAAATSRLLVNEYTASEPLRFSAAALSIKGRVTSSVWTDIDGNGWVDLLVVDEWRGLRLFYNDRGQLGERDLKLSLPPGKWSAVVPVDVGNDGAMDYGLMNASGESGVLKNDGAGFLQWRPLPLSSQWAPVSGAQWLDADGDGRQDLFVMQNRPQWRWPGELRAGGVGQAFRGLPGEGFRTWSPQESGLVVSGIATALAVTDFNNDEAPDLLVARHDQPMLALERTPSALRWLTIRFRGPLKNIMGAGAAVSVEWNGRLRLSTELYVGNGYLTQTPNRIFFPRPAANGGGMVKVLWPDGTRSQLAFSQRERSVFVRHRG